MFVNNNLGFVHVFTILGILQLKSLGIHKIKSGNVDLNSYFDSLRLLVCLSSTEWKLTKKCVGYAGCALHFE